MPHIIDMLNDIGSYTYVTALDLSMGYYHFELDDELKDLCTFMLPTGLYRYLPLPMGLNISPDLFQEKMEKLFCDMPNMKIYIDDLLIFSNGSYEDHLAKVKNALDRLHSKHMAVNAEKSFWAVREVAYRGFRLTPEVPRWCRSSYYRTQCHRWTPTCYCSRISATKIDSLV
jgi:Reverse transcriptase (RNA-dependent DNA polymerase)